MCRPMSRRVAGHTFAFSVRRSLHATFVFTGNIDVSGRGVHVEAGRLASSSVAGFANRHMDSGTSERIYCSTVSWTRSPSPLNNFVMNDGMIQMIQEQELGSAEYGHTRFSDLSPTEFASKYFGSRPPTTDLHLWNTYRWLWGGVFPRGTRFF